MSLPPVLLPFISTVIDKIFPNAEDAQKAQAELLKLAQQSDFKQMEINLAQSTSDNVFISGARPCIMWVCAFIFGYNYLLQPLFIFILTLFDKQITTLPVFKIDEILPVLLGMLGLGGLRTFEKIKGITR
jgi:hypothetical protein